MAVLTVRNVPDEVHRALRLRARRAGRSTEAEVRAILEATVKPLERVKLGTLLYELGRSAGITNEDVEMINSVRDRTPAEPIRFE